MVQLFSLGLFALTIMVACCQLTAYKANPTYVDGMATNIALAEFKGSDVVSRKVTATSWAEMDVTIRLKQLQQTEEKGLLATEEIRYALQLKTFSRCPEFERGCLDINEKKVLKTVSLKTQI